MAKDVLHLESDEHIILEVRKHWIVFIGYGIQLIFSAIFPIVLLFLAKKFFPQVLDIAVAGNINALMFFVYSIWLMFLWLSFFINWTKYYLDVWYVTEKRIIAVDQRGIFNRGISNLRFDKIQDVTIDVKGFVATLLNYGNVKVQTAGEDNFEFSMYVVSNPENVRKVIFNQHNEIGDRRPPIF